jgi:RIO-like serine/threonine protein kinase
VRVVEAEDSAVLERVEELVSRYRIVTPEELRRRIFSGPGEFEEALPQLSRVLSEPRPLTSGGTGYYFQKAGERPLCPVAVARAYAILEYCSPKSLSQ